MVVGCTRQQDPGRQKWSWAGHVSRIQDDINGRELDMSAGSRTTEMVVGWTRQQNPEMVVGWTRQQDPGR